MSKIRIHGTYIAILIVVAFATGTCKEEKKDWRPVNEKVRLFKTMVRFEDSKGAAITSLEGTDLQVMVDKKIIPLVLFKSSKTPLSLFLILDVTNIEDANGLHASLQEIIKKLPHDTEVSFMSSNLGNESSNQFSKDGGSLTKLIQEYKPEGRSTFFVSLSPFAGAASRYLQKSDHRAAAIYITAEDSFFENEIIKKESEVIREHLTQAAVAVPIFGIYLGNENGNPEKRDAMLEVLKATGGTTFFAKNTKDLNDGIAKIIAFLDGLYLIGIDAARYIPDGKTHHLEVELSPDASKKYVAARSTLAADFSFPMRKADPSPNPPLEIKPDSEAKSKSN